MTGRSNRSDGIGAPLRRREDVRLLTGRGFYSSDNFPDGLCHAVMVRSPHAHAEIRSINTKRAKEVPGVLAVLTGTDAIADGMGPIPHNPDWQGPPDAELRLPPEFEIYTTENLPLPIDRVRYVGEAIALVVAESIEAAADAAELVDVDYSPLPIVVDALASMRAGIPPIWPDCANNLSLTCEVGAQEITEDAFDQAEHIVKFDGHIHRVLGNPMEPRAVVGEYDPSRDHYTLRAASGRGAVQTRERLAVTLGVPIENCRAVFGDMGGNFGTRNAFSPEFALMPWAARKVSRPVKWTASRTECFLSDYQARDLHSHAELALDANGNFLGLRGENTLNLGAYTVYFWPLRKGLSMMQGVYNIPAVHFRGHAVLTNTAPTAVYRSAGRPEAIYMIERLIDIAAVECGFDRIELRRQNLIQSDAMPFTNGVGVTYDSGDYAACMDDALEVADWNGFSQRKAESASRGFQRGIAVANYIEVTSGIPRERVELTVAADGAVEMVTGTMSSGQGHETSFPQLIAEWLEVPFEKIRFIANDTDRVSVGGGSHSGRSMRLVSIAAREAVEQFLAIGKEIASGMLQAPVEEIVYANGEFATAGGAGITLFDLAESAYTGSGAPNLKGVGDIVNRAGGYPYGTHVCEVEVDPESGKFEILRWSGVDDVGRAINPLILHGQAHGAATQGIGQAFLEAIEYSPDSAQLLTGSFMDYAMPRADNTPAFNMRLMEIPASSHPHGIRPGGEGGTTPALGLLINAITNALTDYGVRDIPMPATAERVWQAVQETKNITCT
ncbi:MAG: 6-hydroxypseudooxynicotine dehydrogenase complex subunit gamma [Alphaproteobacteria bacterium MarineAlpha4_Bin2]|nr:MAG: 6-hydroxypseudooxynicotine dehydrogenase complex subunit gamma [Alphaproteobacteria bacterium MarineAlpha4_Bin2]